MRIGRPVRRKVSPGKTGREAYQAHLRWRIENDRECREIRQQYSRIFAYLLEDFQRRNDGHFAWPHRY